MNINNILNDIQQADPEFGERISHRRGILKSFGSKITAIALPLALGAMIKKAYGKTTDAVYDALAFALSLEYLEHEFYATAIDANTTSSFIPAEHLPGIQKILYDEKAHVDFLSGVLSEAGAPMPPKPTYDFTGGYGAGNGPYVGTFSVYSKFLEQAQVFEDLGVRAYKGQVPNLMANDTFMRAALNIHSVEAKHAAHIRMIRNVPGLMPWITAVNTGITTNNATQKIYAGEDMNAQSGIPLININGFEISNESATEAFDEPFGRDQVTKILSEFIKP